MTPTTVLLHSTVGGYIFLLGLFVVVPLLTARYVYRDIEARDGDHAAAWTAGSLVGGVLTLAVYLAVHGD
jgi:hypothetical protein